MNSHYEKISCPICASKNFKILKNNTNPKITSKELKKFYNSSSDKKLIDQLSECTNCNFVLLNPRVKKNIVINSYKNNPDKEFVKHNKYRLKTFIFNFRRVLNFLSIDKKKNLRILDIGTGGGTFLLAAKQLGFKAEGLEPNKWLVNYIKKNLNVAAYQGTLESIKFKKKFDLISFWDVFEHVVDLNKTLKICRKILKKDGQLLLNIPDHGSLARKILGNKWPFYLNVHLYYFEKKTLNLLLKKHGFKFKKKLIHLQLLPLKYIFKRAGNYFKFFNYLNKKISNKFDFGIWYNVGQNIYIYKK
jgi:2-polyprenyl-3-methyl-5-hydroxy-6-metoxy-1,4-benzoquinol methylase|tara:strand:- start:21 stop:929 length:909 start_codon:yes stop_codon:yes gene_type:complete